ncbi:hypothetical protein [Acinetobacter populi]|uniref:Lipoprotein n=1 Tax=Acinetobacter populi TaxID=1582270 RepID=A0A1Z9Z025_9GAMM|nr:hypothetical protein [Acinetobacter populi]OUY07804.1 hypothetical protein CAP51_08765 [Acinetobacter populi]
MINKTALKTLSFSIITALMLSACGGSGSNNSNDSTSTNTENTDNSNNSSGNNNSNTNTGGSTDSEITNALSFPFSEFDIQPAYVGKKYIYSILENQWFLANSLLSSKADTIFQQIGALPVTWWGEYEYILTKDKLYQAKDGLHSYSVIKNSNPTLTLSYGNSDQDLTQTITYKTIDLSNKKVVTPEVINELFYTFDDSTLNDSGFIKLKQDFSQLGNTFADKAICYQYLTHKFSQDTLSFDGDSTVGQTYNQWIEKQKNADSNIVEEKWATYNVAYLADAKGNYQYGYQDIVVEINGTLYYAELDTPELYEYEEDYDAQEFKAGICSSYNESAAQTLKTAIQSLPKN